MICVDLLYFLYYYIRNMYLFFDYLCYMWIILIKEKSEVFEKFKRFKVIVE